MVRGSVFRGYRALPVAATGAIAIAAAAAQPALVPEPAADPAAWARFG